MGRAWIRTPTMRATRGLLLGAVGMALAMSGCLDDTPTATRPSVRLSLNANVVGQVAGGTVRIRVGYRTNQQTLVTLPSNPQQVTLAAGATVVVPVTVDIGPCLKDRNRVAATRPGCQLTIELTLTDAGETIDTQTREAPKTATPGTSVDFGTVTIGVRVSTITVAPATVTTTVGQDRQLTATVRDPAGALIPTAPVTWATSDPTVVQIGATSGQSVTVRTLKLGVATVSASAGGKTSNAVGVTVILPTPLIVRQRPAAGCVIVGQTIPFEVDTPPAAVAWTSADPAIATVNPTTGVVTGVSAGQTTITASSGNQIGTAPVCVIGPFVVTPSNLTIAAARTAQLLVSNSLGATISYTSSTGSVASVSSTGVVHAITVGQATITVTIIGASGTITVPVPVTVIASSVDVSPTTATVSTNGSARYAVVVRDADGNILPDVPAAWTIADPTIGTLSATSGPTVDVRALKIGNTTVRATVPGGSASATFTVTAPLPAVGLQKVSGDGSVCPSQSTGCTFVARAVDANGVPVPGVAVSWASPTACATPFVVTTDAFGLSKATNPCATAPPGTYTQTATLTSNQQQASFSYTLQGLSIVLLSIDTAGVRTYGITSLTTQASGLTVAARYRSGPVANYVEVLTLSRALTPAVLTVAFDESQLPIGDYVLDVTVSTTTPGFGPAVETIVFNPVNSFSISNARRRPDSARAPVAPGAP